MHFFVDLDIIITPGMKNEKKEIKGLERKRLSEYLLIRQLNL